MKKKTKYVELKLLITMKNKITEKDYINAVKKADREREIELFGKQISTRPTRIHNPKIIYKRQKYKINLDDQY